MHEQNRHHGRRVSRRAVESTLFLQGLEADLAVILQPEQMDPCNLVYVATRLWRGRLSMASIADGDQTELLPVLSLMAQAFGGVRSAERSFADLKTEI